MKSKKERKEPHFGVLGYTVGSAIYLGVVVVVWSAIIGTMAAAKLSCKVDEWRGNSHEE